MKTAQVRPITTSQKYSNELKCSANSASAGAATISAAVPNRPPTAEKTSPAPSASSAWPFFRHRVRLVGVGGRRRRSRHPEQAAGDVAGEDRHRGGGHDGGDRRDRRHEERHRDEQRRRHRRREAGHGADEEAEQRRREHDRDVVRIEDEAKRLDPGGAHGVRCRRASCAAAPRTRRTHRRRPAAARDVDHHAMPCSTPHGSGTRSSL
jgi:hypothetical protein